MSEATFLETLWQDVRYGLRMLRKNPGFTSVAVLTLALGIGANTAIFSLIDGLLLRSLPVHNPQELVVFQWTAHKTPEVNGMSSYGDCKDSFGPPPGETGPATDPESCSFPRPYYDQIKTQTNVFSGVVGFGPSVEFNLTGDGPASIVHAHLVSGNYFDTLGVRPAIGRVIEPSDDTPDAPPVMMLSYGYWQRQFGGSLSALNKKIELNGVPASIIGVAEPRFGTLTPGSETEAWVPLSLAKQAEIPWLPKDSDPGSFWMVLVGRLKPGVSRTQAVASASLLFRNQILYGPKALSKEADAPRVNLLPAQSGLHGARGEFSTPLYILMLAVGIILLIACANVAGLLISRSTARQKEMALRLAIGAGRSRIVRQLLTESVLLSLIGGALGVLFAFWGAHVILGLVASSSSRPSGLDAAIDYRVLLFTVGISLITGMVFGLAPALRSMNMDLTPALKEGAGGSVAEGRIRHKWFNVGHALVVLQVALAMVVLVGAGLLVRTLKNLRDIDPGFVTSNLLNFRINPVLAGYKDTQVDIFYRNLLGRLNTAPGVTSAAYSQMNLLGGGLMMTSLHVPGSNEAKGIPIDVLSIGPNFFDTTKMPLLQGREFSPSEFEAASTQAAKDRAEHEKGGAPGAEENKGKEKEAGKNPPPAALIPAIINETFVRKYFPKVSPLGQRLDYPDEVKKFVGNRPGYVVVGVVHDARYGGLRREVNPTMYTPLGGGGVVFELRTASNPLTIVPAVRSLVNEMDPNIPVMDVQTESAAIDQLLFQERLIAQLSSFFGLLALALACIGLYGLLAYEVARRTQEIGIRMALGAGTQRVLANVIGKGLALSVVGVVIGVGVAIGVTRYLKSVLYDVRATDPITLVSVAAILLLVALLACYIPARRATRVDPMAALRNE
jgi:predicted permease